MDDAAPRLVAAVRGHAVRGARLEAVVEALITEPYSRADLDDAIELARATAQRDPSDYAASLTHFMLRMVRDAGVFRI